MAFHCALLHVTLHLPASQTLKDKRRRLLPLTRDLGRLPYISVCEVAEAQCVDRSAWCITCCGCSRVEVDRGLAYIEQRLTETMDLVILAIEQEWLT